MNEQKGVTLIELLVAVAIIGILTVIAYPSYESHVFKGHRSQAMADLMKIQLTLEEKYTQSGSYDFSIVAADTCAFCETDTTRYHLTIKKGSGMDKYKVVATPQTDKGQTKDECGILYLNAAGVGTAEKIGGGCW
ncbi:prepilin-type cleavage/methylation domain-containing protein [Photobacterium frigidiphilum]|uniref:Prepilin-type cleavage/methylation domain-containing protein n=1 Tax=Photobacterium frigidiphilum TaxID=264736 RepID=A0A2T3JD67_9GAMM|nr:type IV pilin protein [Photobacterium frigidiphilum]PSU46793.1 prepilin-type cleavage/methylation domain-containing protein [Photobacterium frigidiphilum]